jgi:hypothetical protein
MEPAELVVSAPDGERPRIVPLAGGRLTVGRLADGNDIALQPDPELLVTRVAHLTIEADGTRWSVVDGGSVNGTFVRRGDSLQPVLGRTPLHDGDVVCVLAATEGGRRYFELAFRSVEDSQATRPAGVRPLLQKGACLSYDGDEARLLVVSDGARHEIPIRAQAHRLVGYMVERNAASGGAAVLCTHDELMEAVWAGEPLHNRMELAKLVWELRKKLDPFGAADLIENERGLGYRLRTCQE